METDTISVEAAPRFHNGYTTSFEDENCGVYATYFVQFGTGVGVIVKVGVMLGTSVSVGIWVMVEVNVGV